MSCFRLTSPAWVLLACACNDQLLTVLPDAGDDSGSGVADSESEVEPEDTGLDSGGGDDTGEHVPPCGGGELGEADGRPLRRSDDTDAQDTKFASVYFSSQILPAGGGELWVAGNDGWYADTHPNWDGAYLLDGTSWDDPELASNVLPTLYMGDPLGTSMIASGLTVDPSAAGEALWVSTPSNQADDLDGSWLWLSASIPTRGVDLMSWASAEVRVESGNGEQSSFADYNSDGVDDAMIPGHPTVMLLAPFSGTLTEADADVTFPDRLAAGVADFRPDSSAALDLDGDGHLDFVWKQANGERDDHTQFDLFFKRGPLAGGPAWDAPDAVLIDDVSRLPDTDYTFLGPPDGAIRAVGDVTGDGAPDATVAYNYDAGGEPGSSSLFIVNRLPQGTGSIADLETRLVGVPGDDLGSEARSWVGSGGGGDMNGDGFGDLVAFQASTLLAGGPERRSYVVTGPLSGVVRLDQSATQMRLAYAADGIFEENGAALVPDLDGDGMDDVIVSAVDGINPGVAWLFPGCAAW
jgi:hypothetical protein